MRSRAPHGRRAPRLYAAACESGVVTRLRDDVPEAVADAVGTATRGVADVDGVVASCLPLLNADASVTAIERGLSWTFPAPWGGLSTHPTIASSSQRGDALIRRLERDGMPPALIERGFADTGEFWPPWCASLEGDAIASLAFTVGETSRSAEVGVDTVRALRGRGHAAAACAAWASHPGLAGRVLFYSTSVENVSSQRVVERLGLLFLGHTLSIT